MTKKFKGRVILAGNVEGEAIVSLEGVNMLASFQSSILKKSKKAICSDQNNKYLYKKVLTNKILCLPQTIGSTTAGIVMEKIFEMGIGPKALLFSEQIDSLAAAGVVLSEVWLEKRVITIDNLGKEFLETVKDGQTIKIEENGIVYSMEL